VPKYQVNVYETFRVKHAAVVEADNEQDAITKLHKDEYKIFEKGNSDHYEPVFEVDTSSIIENDLL